MNAFAPRRLTETHISEAVTLGWRIATLYSLRADELPSAPPENLLPVRRSLPAAERLVLELRAAAGDASRLDIGMEPAELATLVALARRAPDSPDDETRFLNRIRAWHIDLQTKLWADHEPTGKAYELGSFLSDTSNRVVRALRRPGDAGEHVTSELREVFSARRVEDIKRLLDDLQTRIDPAAVRIVKQHLERWEAVVGNRRAECIRREDLEPLDGQAIIWCQLVTGDKEPEAYIDHEDRTRVRGTMVGRTVRSYVFSLRCAVTVVLGLSALIGLVVGIPPLIKEFGPEVIASIGGPIAGAVCVGLASVGRTVRKSLDARAELLWNTALVEVISQKTLRVDELLPETSLCRAWRVPVAPLRAAVRMQVDRAA